MRDVLGRVWWWFATMTTLATISTIVAFSIAVAYSHEGPVIRRVGDLDHLTLRVPEHGELSYEISVDRRESCKGDFVARLKQVPTPGADSPRVVITISRPVIPDNLLPGIRPPITNILVLPDAVTKGRWNYVGGIESQCPTRKRFDILAAFEFEVTER